MTTNDDNKKSIHTSGDYIDTGGGDYAQGNIDKRQGGTFVEGNVYGNVIAVNQGTINIAPTMTAQERRNRSRMLQKVRDFWVKGVLERSLYNEVLIELGLETRPDAVLHPWDMLIQEPDREARPLPSGTKIVNVFDGFGGELLILGAPGSGKTTMLLELARDLISRAAQDENLPIPVVFNLSSWAEKRAPLVEWLVDELNARYDVPRQVGKAWIGTDTVLPLLDGLDEVKQDQRAACVEAINTFRQDHGLVNVVVCSRLADYDALSAQLKLQGAVLVQPLTLEQIDAYLESMGDQLRTLRAALVGDEGLRGLAESPLMLSIMTVAYQGSSVDALTESGTLEESRQHLFAAYVERMFVRRGADTRFTKQKTVRWLSWLACEMTNQAQSVFYIEGLQVEWLSNYLQRWAYIIGVWAIFGFAIGMVLSILLSMMGNISENSSVPYTLLHQYWLVAQLLLVGIFSGILAGIIWIAVDMVVEYARKYFSNWTALFIGGFVGVVGWWFVFNGIRIYFLYRGVVAAPFLIWGLLFWMNKQIESVDKLAWSWMKAVRAFIFALTVSCIGVFLALLTFAVTFWLIIGKTVTSNDEKMTELTQALHTVIRQEYLPSNLIVIMCIMLTPVILLAVLLNALSGIEIDARTMTNQGIRQSARNAIITWLIVGLSTSLVFGIALQWIGSGFGLPNMSVLEGFLPGLIVGFFAAMINGGFSCNRHLALRLVLWCSSAMPWNIGPFLDYCAERIFLRKVGGGYIFIHRLLMEHFASLYDDDGKATR